MEPKPLDFAGDVCELSGSHHQQTHSTTGHDNFEAKDEHTASGITASGMPFHLKAYDQDSNRLPYSLPFKDQERFYEIRQEDGICVLPEIHCEIERGFFMSIDGDWTCYRRNYFSTTCSYSLHPPAEPNQLFLSSPDSKSSLHKNEKIRSIAMSLSAIVDGIVGRTAVVELVQHTPKRDKGPQTPIKLIELLPTTAHDIAKYGNPPLPGGFTRQLLATPATTHTFERVQFKSATQNNGRRRAQQQHYRVRVELWADVRSRADTSPAWIKVAQRDSTPVVVRGRSPSHYQNEAPHSSRPPGRPSDYSSSWNNNLDVVGDVLSWKCHAAALDDPLSPTQQTLSIYRPGNLKSDIRLGRASEKDVLDDSSVSCPGVWVCLKSCSLAVFVHVIRGGHEYC